MIRPLTREQRIRRGESAQQLLDNPLAMAALDEMQANCFERWAETSHDDVEGREFNYKLFLAVRLLRGKLATWSGDAIVEINNADARKRDDALYN